MSDDISDEEIDRLMVWLEKFHDIQAFAFDGDMTVQELAVTLNQLLTMMRNDTRPRPKS